VTYPFGQSFTAWFFPLVDDQTPAGLLTSSNLVAIYVFDQMPSRNAAANGTGAVQTITSWTWDASKNGFSYSIAAISDPDPTSTTPVRTYWRAINFRLQASQQVQTVLQSFDLERVTGPAFTIEVSDSDLAAYFPQVTSYSSAAQRLAYVAQAKEEVRARLRVKGFQWAKIHRADRLDMAVTFKALSMLMLAQVQQPGDKFAMKYTEFKSMYENALESIQFEYDADGNGQPETEGNVPSGLWVIR
jgi:hypothetical protein